MSTITLESTTEVIKHNNNWIATTSFDLGDNHRLRVKTYRNTNGQLQTIAIGLTIMLVGAYELEEYSFDKDYNKLLVRNHELKRITEQNITDVHNKVLETISNTYEDAFNFYNAKN